VDDVDDVAESNEDNNISPGKNPVHIVDTSPDLEVLDWYTEWDDAGNAFLTYDVSNSGQSTAPSGWLITLALSADDLIPSGDEIFVFGEQATFSLNPGHTLFRDNSSPATYSIVTDFRGNPVPDGEYFLALWLDPDNEVVESNEINNVSF